MRGIERKRERDREREREREREIVEADEIEQLRDITETVMRNTLS